MSVEWNDILGLPQAALAGDRRIPKAAVARHSNLTKREQKTLDKVKLLSHFATVQKSTTRILPYVDESYNIESIVFLRCEMSEKSVAFAEVSGLLHRCFPNPTVLLMVGSAGACISAALTRKSLSEKRAVVVEEQRSTGGLNLDDPKVQDILRSLAFAKLPQENLLVYLREMLWRIRLIRSTESLGFYPECGERKRGRLVELLGKIEQLGHETMELSQARRSKEVSLNEQMKLRVRLKDIEKQCDLTVVEIKELCGGRD